MAPSPRYWSDLEHLRVEITSSSLHPEIVGDSRYDLISGSFDDIRSVDWPFAEAQYEQWPAVRLPKGVEAEGMRVAFFDAGAAFYNRPLVNEPHAIVGFATYQCTFKRLHARTFERRLVALAGAFKEIERQRRGAGRRVSAVFVVDDIREGSANWKMTLLACTFIGGAIYGTADLIGQYPAIKAGAIELFKDAGFIARELEPAERSMCETEFDA